MKKEYIPISVKKAVWEKYSHPSDSRISQCQTCGTLVRYPESISYYINKSQNFLPYEISGVGEFGHLYPESKGGTASIYNLIIQCKTCNCSNATHIISKILDQPDTFMIPSELIENPTLVNNIPMEINSLVCQKKLVSGNFCKNKPLFNKCFCHIHIKN